MNRPGPTGAWPARNLLMIHTIRGTIDVRTLLLILGGLAVALAIAIAPAQAATGVVEGYLRDARTKEPLPGGNIMLRGTSIGVATDLTGRYRLINVPVGNYTLRATYVGYNTREEPITVGENGSTTVNVNLENVGVEGETVTITGQASGQTQAINQQLTSNQIVNVVSAEKIQGLPDANAAESVGRLPGVTVLRYGGEGNTVVIRGLQPKYNKILIDGVQVATAQSDDRSTDLSTISSNMLDAISVSKSVTSDMDADVLGGTVNFSLREAKPHAGDIPAISALAQGGYNDLSNARDRYNNYKLVLSAENRYFGDDLGVFAQADFERKNLTSNELGAVYTHYSASMSSYLINSIGLYNVPRDRQRANGALVLDYNLPGGKIKFSNFVSTGSTNATERYENLDVANNAHLWQLSETDSKLTTLTNSIGLEHQVFMFDADLKLSHTYSELKTPNGWAVNFLQQSAGIGGFSGLANVDPQAVPKAANDDFAQAIMNGISSNSSFSRERGLTASLDLKTRVDLAEGLNAEIKFGGKYRYQTRSYDAELYNGGGLQFGSAAYINDLIISYFQLPVPRYKISLPYFEDASYGYGKMLGGKYSMIGPLDYGRLGALISMIKAHEADINANPGAAEAYGRNEFSSTFYNYDGIERRSAAYAMSVLHIGEDITFIPGVRYQELRTEYTGVRGVENRLSYLVYNHYDTTVARKSGYWLPALSLRYRPVSWADARLSFTKTLAYPDFNAIIPRIDVNGISNIITWNNYALTPQRSNNYDATISFYDNSIGLVSVGGFYKQIDDLIYSWTFYVSGAKILQYFPPAYAAGAPVPPGVYFINTFINDPQRAKDYGFELEWQTHFWYLPSPLSGLVFDINYTRTWSEAHYPLTIVRQVNRTSVYIDTSFTDRLLDQPNELLNVSLGYDYSDFSVRVSMLYHTDIFTGVNFWPQQRSQTTAYRRWDIAAKQTLPWFGLQLFCDVNNVNGASDVSVSQGAGSVPLSEQEYGLTAEFGIRWNL